VRAIQEGYFFGSDKFFPSGTDNSIVIRMLPLDNAKEIDPNSDTQVSVDGGGNIEFQANSFVDSDGDAYNGVVSVYAKRINPEAPFSHEVMPGNLFGISERGTAVVLESYAMLAVELRDKDGGELNLAAGKPAIVKFKVDDKLLDEAPKFIPTWSFDETQGNWIEEGEAELIDGNYVSEVAHFSFWNCDAPYPLVNVTGKVVDTDGVPQEGFYILVKTNGMCGAGYTNSEGVFSGKMPKNQELTFCVFSPGCSEPIFTTTLGPFTENVELEDFVVEGLIVATYGGVVLCEGEPLANADVYLLTPNLNEKYTTSEDGQFLINIEELSCNGIDEGSLFAQNPSTGIISEMIIVNSEDQLDLELEVCVDCDIAPYITENDVDQCDNETVLTINIDNPATTYIYTWSNGATTADVVVNDPGLYCVTITEPITECFLTVCKEIEFNGALSAGITNVQNMYCNNPGFISLEIGGGTEPYQIEWQTPSMVINGGTFLDANEPGTYSVTITDANGCQIFLSQEIEQEVGTEYIEIIFDFQSEGFFCEGDSLLLYVEPWQANGLDTSQIVWTLNDTTHVGGSFNAIESGIVVASFSDGICEYLGETYVNEIATTFDFIGYNCSLDTGQTILEYSSDDGQMYYTYLVDTTLIFNYPDGFSGTTTLYNWPCNSEVEYELPFATNVEIEVLSMASCDECEDGYIEVNLDGFTCDCAAGEVTVYAANGYTDVTEANEAQILAAGTYYLVVRSQEDCIVYSEEFEL